MSWLYCMWHIQPLAFFFLVMVLGFELTASQLQDRHSTVWVMPPAIYTLVIFQIGSYFTWWWPRTQLSYFMLSTVTGITTSSSFPLRWNLKNFFQCWSGTVIVPISAFWVTGKTAACHYTQIFIEVGSHKLFAQAGLELWSKWSVSKLSKLTGMSHQHQINLSILI
jgi:hypothetical protein